MFNKYDQFKEKIKKVPITVALNDFFIDGNQYDENEVMQFVGGKIVQCLEDRNIQLDSPLHIYRVNALDTNNVKKIFSEIMRVLVVNYYNNVVLG